MLQAPVSVVIPCHNAALTIERALASVAEQSVRPYEVLVVDDASDDKTPDILLRLVGRYGHEWLKVVFWTENRGPAAARNHCLELASQPLVAFLDADDSWHRDKISIQSRFMLAHPEYILTGHGWTIRESDLKKELETVCRFEEYTLYRLCYKNVFRTPTAMLRHHYTKIMFNEKQRFSEDFRFWLEILATGHRAAYLCVDLAVTHKRPFGIAGLSASLVAMEKGELQALHAVRKHLGWWHFGGSTLWSLLKFVRRVLFSGLHLFIRRARELVVFS